MRVIEQSWEWVRPPTQDTLKFLELCGRVCYKSEGKIGPGSAERLVRKLLASGHHSVIEHASATVRFITDRGVTHELVRHRLASYSQESTRYCNYSGDHIQFIRPVWLPDLRPGVYTWDSLPGVEFGPKRLWIYTMLAAESSYRYMLAFGWRPEQARTALPNSLKTEIIMTANLREWRHVFGLRCSKAAHPQMRELMLSCLKGFYELVPVLFEDLAQQHDLVPHSGAEQSEQPPQGAPQSEALPGEEKTNQ